METVPTVVEELPIQFFQQFRLLPLMVKKLFSSQLVELVEPNKCNWAPIRHCSHLMVKLYGVQQVRPIPCLLVSPCRMCLLAPPHRGLLYALVVCSRSCNYQCNRQPQYPSKSLYQQLMDKQFIRHCSCLSRWFLAECLVWCNLQGLKCKCCNSWHRLVLLLFVNCKFLNLILFTF